MPCTKCDNRNNPKDKKWNSNNVWWEGNLHNNNVDKGKVLIIKDSFSVVVIPFLSLAVQDVVVWDMRATKDGLYDFIEQNDFDAVILAYSGVWNFEMFQFN